MVWLFSDDLRIPSGNPSDLIVNLHGVPAVGSSRNVVKRVACFRTAENRVLRPVSGAHVYAAVLGGKDDYTVVSTGFGSFEASSAAVSDLCVLEP